MAHAHPAPAEPTLRQLGDLRGLHVGTATRASTLTGDAAYGAVAAREFNSITPANAMKWASVEPERGEFDWSDADATVAFARAHDQVVRGHTLVWHNQLPSWLTSGGFTGPQVLQLMTEHVATEAGRYAGQIVAWDVVNEPFNEDGTFHSLNDAVSIRYALEALAAARDIGPVPYIRGNGADVAGS